MQIVKTKYSDVFLAYRGHAWKWLHTLCEIPSLENDWLVENPECQLRETVRVTTEATEVSASMPQ
jgi:hypothetical protein